MVKNNLKKNFFTVKKAKVGSIMGDNLAIPDYSGVAAHTKTKEAFLNNDIVNGSIRETFNALATSDGSTITVTVTNAEGGDLTLQFSTGTVKFTGGSTVTLTAGSDASPTENFVYIPISNKVLTVSTSDWPSEEHIKISYFLVPSASFVQSNGTYINQNWNDHLTGTDNMGHIPHIAERIRRQGSVYLSGVGGGGTDGYLTPTASNVELISDAGVIFQMHKHIVPAFDTSAGDVVLVKNWNGDAYHDITNLFDITDDSTGATIGNNKYFNLTVWGVANKSGEYAPMIINLPGGSYNTQSDAENDVSGYDDFVIPAAFSTESSTGFLIARITIQMGTTWTVTNTKDLRGTTPQTASGGVAGITTQFADNNFRIFDETDSTKLIAFDVGTNITTGTTRTYKATDADGTIPLIENAQTWTATQTLGTDTKVQFRDAGVFIHSSADGDLELSADTDIFLDINGTNQIKLLDGVFAPVTDNDIDLGTTSLKWKNVFIAGDLRVDGEIEGSRMLFNGSVRTSTAGSGFFNFHSETFSSTCELVAMRSGSIVGLSGNVNITSYSSSGSLGIQAKINGVTALNTSKTITGNGQQKWYSTQGRNTLGATFSAGDGLTLTFTKAGSYTVNDFLANCEIVHDT